MFRNYLVLSVLVTLFSVPPLVSASGTESLSNAPSAPRAGHASSLADVTYEHGKSLFKGRDNRYGKIKYCVASGAEQKKLKKSSLKPYAGGSAQVLMDSLYNCDVPDQKIQTVFTKTDMTALVFYLNRRHKLKLKR